MLYRTIGQGLGLSALGVGCMPMAGSQHVNYGVADRREAIATIHRAIDLGVTLFDTAEAYGPWTNEELLAEAIRGRRTGLVIVTKFAYAFDGNGKTSGKADGSPANVRRALEGSLRRLGVDTIDLYYQHRVDPETPIEETVGAMARFVEEGKVRHLGLSEAGVETIRRAHRTHPITALQSEYSLWERAIENEILPACRELGIGIIPYSPLGRGFLTGTIRSRDDLTAGDYRLRDPRFSVANFARNLRLVDAIRRVSTPRGASAAQVALAWLLAQGNDIVPIPGAKRRETMEDSMKAADLVISVEELDALTHGLPRGAAAGKRYDDSMMQTVEL